MYENKIIIKKSCIKNLQDFFELGFKKIWQKSQVPAILVWTLITSFVKIRLMLFTDVHKYIFLKSCIYYVQFLLISIHFLAKKIYKIYTAYFQKIISAHVCHPDKCFAMMTPAILCHSVACEEILNINKYKCNCK